MIGRAAEALAGFPGAACFSTRLGRGSYLGQNSKRGQARAKAAPLQALDGVI
jgi:hypothetical protein